MVFARLFAGFDIGFLRLWIKIMKNFAGKFVMKWQACLVRIF